MKKYSSSIGVTAIFVIGMISSQAASVVIEPFSTISTEPAPTIQTSESIVLDLSDTAGLIEGAPISVGLNSGGSLVWIGGFSTAGAGFEVNVTASLVLQIGDTSFGTSFSVLDLSIPDDAIVDSRGGGATVSDPIGLSLVDFPALSVTVPWGTDLSEVRLTLSQEAAVNQGVLTSSELTFILPAEADTTAFSLLAESVPEPSTAILVLLGISVGIFRRR